jgi:2-keto-4-pentenoate hydratase/2-oxohepta-3-ene-1,7-dioic acid hydratase in catechol pathway
MRYVRYESESDAGYGILDGNFIRPISKSPWCLYDSNQSEVKTKISLDNARLLAPCLPSKIIGVALNYPGVTGVTDNKNEPLIFLKPSTSIIGTKEEIVNPFNGIDVWGECELAIVIGKYLKDATKEEALDSIFGYTVANDVSASNVNSRDHHLARSKAVDTFCVIGPWIDTNFKPDQQRIQGYHNGDLLRDGRLSDRLWKEQDLLMWLSTWITLEPGDIILTGAPSRVGGRKYLQNGDIFKCEIQGLGELINPFREKYE